MIYLVLLTLLLVIMWAIALIENWRATKWEKRCREAWGRDVIPRSMLQESGLHLKVGEMIAPIYKPIAIFDVPQAMTVKESCILRDGQAIQPSRLLTDGPRDLTAGDRLYLHVDCR